MKVYIKTYGCQMNERDSENLAAQLEARGHQVVETESLADVFIANTCAVREAAEKKAIGKISRICHTKKGGFPLVGVMGCMAQNRGENLLENCPHLDLSLGTRKSPYIVEELEKIYAKAKAGKTLENYPKVGTKKIKNPNAVVDISDDEHSHKLIKFHYSKRPQTCANISVMQGCAMKCSYCIVPRTKGIERSRPLEDIVKEAQDLAAQNAKEITLLGQVVNAFGRGEIEIKNGLSPFVQLLEKLDKIKGLERLRFLSPHPSYFKQDLIEAYGRLRTLCEYAHLPLQSGSNALLKEMNRPYKAEKFLKIVENLRKQKPLFSISTDVIVGYPNESLSDFDETCDIFKKSNFDMAYIFKYSPRPLTPSANLVDNISEEEKERRNQILLEILRPQSLEFNEKLIGTEQEVLVESEAKRGNNMLVGRTRTHRKVIFKACPELVGQLVNVKILNAGVSAMEGVLAD